jgi:putative SOS response-associated peptidase YedK
MCGRFTILYTWDEIYRYYQLIGETPTNWGPSFNVCPTDEVGTIVMRDGRRRFARMRWGIIPFFHKQPKKEWKSATFNARAETIEKLPTFRNIWRRSRCLIPASGYYEWNYRDPANKKEKPQPYYFTARDGAPLVTIAGIWDRWRDPENNNAEVHSCAMIITAPNQFVGQVHDRMPVLLQPHQFDAWLNGALGKEALVPAPEDSLRRWPVSQRVNSSKAPADDADLISEIEIAA